MPSDPQNIRLVRKLNSLVESRYKMSLAEQKMLLMLASTVQEGDDDFHPYVFSVSQLNKLCGVTTHDAHKRVHETIKRLVNRVVQIDNGGGNYTLTHWVGSADYFHGEGTFELTFHPKLRPYFLHLRETYTSYRLANVIRLRSKYSVRMYELLKRYETLGKHLFLLEDLRGALGIPNHEYSSNAQFRIRVLEPAKKELSESTDIKFRYKRILKLRRIIGYEFIVSTNKREVPEVERKELSPHRQATLPFTEDLAAQRSPEEMNIAKEALAEIQKNLSTIPSF